MRHKSNKKSLGRTTDQKKALMRNLAESLIAYDGIQTTQAKAKELKKFVEPLVTKAKQGTLAERRLIIKALYTDEAVNKLMNDIGPRYKERQGGYTRIIKLGARQKDGAEMVRIEFV